MPRAAVALLRNLPSLSKRVLRKAQPHSAPNADQHLAARAHRRVLIVLGVNRQRELCDNPSSGIIGFLQPFRVAATKGGPLWPAV